MKKLLFVLSLTCVLALAANAEDKKPEGKKPAMTEEQKALRKEMTEKYDTNKDGKLDKEERAKISEEDKAKMGGSGHAKKKKAK